MSDWDDKPIMRPNTGAELAARFLMLGPDHRAVFELLLDKAEAGRKKYGVLQLDADGRDFEAEARAELLDCVHYLGAAVVQLKRAAIAGDNERDRLRQENARLQQRLAHAQRAIDAQMRSGR